MKLFTDIIVILYGLFIILASFSIIKEGNNIIGFLFLLCSISLFFAIYLKDLFILVISLLLISFLSWTSAPKLVSKRNVSHHLIRLLFHLFIIGIGLVSHIFKSTF